MHAPPGAPFFQPLLRPDQPLRAAPSGIWSTLPAADEAASYDRIAAGYDALIGNPLYNRIVWGCPTSRYADAARREIAQAGPGPILDAGCGSLVFTAGPYADAPLDRMVLLDRSMVMLQRGQRRLPGGAFVQGDGLALPFAGGVFDTVMAWGMLHIFGSQAPFLAELERVAAPGARIALSALVLSNRGLGDRVLGMLHKNGEVAVPETGAAAARAFAERFDADPPQQIGSMLFLTGRRRPAPAAP
jgi:ubiquinone/menaquinone biosynthesis C-methylase UbiE